MNPRAEMPEIDPEIPEHAVSVYGQSDGAYEDFPVLKAFQQYIDSEQAKARKRMLLLCAFFGGLMFVVISVFVVLLISASSRNQMLNDRLVEYVMKDRDSRPGVYVADRSSQESSAVLALTAKLEELQKKLDENKVSTAKIVSDATARAERAEAEAAKPKGPTPEELEIARLKALLATEREKMAVEREKRRQAELEEYRRKHYPELYEKKAPIKEDVVPAKQEVKKTPEKSASDELLEEVDQILNESKAVSYFDDDADVEAAPAKKAKSPSQPQPAPKKEFSIPVDVRGSSSRWSVPNE